MNVGHSVRGAAIVLTIAALHLAPTGSVAPAAAAPTSGGTQPAGNPHRTTGILTVSPSFGPPTTGVTLEGGGFVPDSAVQINFDGSPLYVTWADQNGDLSATAGVPFGSKPGPHTFTAYDLFGNVDAGNFFVLVEWRQVNYDDYNTRFNPYENLIAESNASRLAKLWSRGTRGAVEASAVTFGTKVFVGSDDDKLYALNRDTGAISWTARTGGDVVAAALAIRGFDPQPDPPGKVVVGSMDGTVSTYDTRGKRLWAATLDGPVSSAPVAAKLFDPQPDPPGKIFVGTDGGTMFALGTHDGAVLWKANLDGSAVSGAPALIAATRRWGRSLPSHLIVGTKLGTLAALATHDGSILWSVQTGPINGSPVLADLDQDGIEEILVGSEDGTLYAFAQVDETPKLKWSFRTGGPIGATPAVGDLAGDLDPWVVVGSTDGAVYAIDEVDGGPVQVWASRIGSSIGSSPTIANGLVYLGADDSRLHVLAARDGAPVFISDAITARRSSPVVVDGRVFVGTMSGPIYAFGVPQA